MHLYIVCHTSQIHTNKLDSSQLLSYGDITVIKMAAIRCVDRKDQSTSFCTAHCSTQSPKSYMLYSAFQRAKHPSKLPLPLWVSARLHSNCPFAWGTEPPSNTWFVWHLDRFSRFCTAHGRLSSGISRHALPSKLCLPMGILTPI